MLMQRKLEEAARSVGIAIATLMRWQKMPEFQKEDREARRAAFGQAHRATAARHLGGSRHATENDD